MTRSQLFTAAHRLARQHHVIGECYAVTFGAALKAIRAGATDTLPRHKRERRDELISNWQESLRGCIEAAPHHPARPLLEDAIAWGTSPASAAYWAGRSIAEATCFVSDLAGGKAHRLPF